METSSISTLAYRLINASPNEIPQIVAKIHSAGRTQEVSEYISKVRQDLWEIDRQFKDGRNLPGVPDSFGRR